MLQKIKRLIILGALCGCLCACGDDTMTQGDKYWADAQRADSLEAYLEEEGAYMDWDMLREEGKNEELSLQQQFRIVLLLCTYEYQCLSEADDTEYSYSQKAIGEDERSMFRKDYPDSSPYVNAYLKKVNTETDEFWNAFVVVFDPCEYYMGALLAAAGELDGQTIDNLFKGLNENEMWGMRLKDALIQWVRVHPERMGEYIEEMIAAGIYKDWNISDWERVCFYNSYAQCALNTATIDDALSYISCAKEILLPELESDFGKSFDKEFMLQSGAGEDDFYKSVLTVGVDEGLNLEEFMMNKPRGTIALEGKKVIAFYRNPFPEEFEDAPPPLRILGDFMMELSEEEYPKNVAEADYYLVLSAFYGNGGTYEGAMLEDNSTRIQSYFALTSVDLYEAKTGQFLHHLGVLLEETPKVIHFWRDGENKFAYYPDPVSADDLSCIYHNINEPENYEHLLYSIPEIDELFDD